VAVTPGRPLRVVVAFHSIFYAPLPVAIRGGHFAAEGVEVDPETPALAAGTVDALQSGVADISLSGAAPGSFTSQR
jgi:ABC-type nitrate/sulfonate/bicarbonate transport system substrate-binding protein